MILKSTIEHHFKVPSFWSIEKVSKYRPFWVSSAEVDQEIKRSPKRLLPWPMWSVGSLVCRVGSEVLTCCCFYAHTHTHTYERTHTWCTDCTPLTWSTVCLGSSERYLTTCPHFCDHLSVWLLGWVRRWCIFVWVFRLIPQIFIFKGICVTIYTLYTTVQYKIMKIIDFFESTKH